MCCIYIATLKVVCWIWLRYSVEKSLHVQGNQAAVKLVAISGLWSLRTKRWFFRIYTQHLLIFCCHRFIMKRTLERIERKVEHLVETSSFGYLKIAWIFGFSIVEKFIFLSDNIAALVGYTSSCKHVLNFRLTAKRTVEPLCFWLHTKCWYSVKW